MTEPIRDVHDVELKLYPDLDNRAGPARPAAIGYMMGIRPAVDVVARCAPDDFSYLWALALSGHLSHAYMSFTKPHYNSASVLYMSFSTEPEE